MSGLPFLPGMPSTTPFMKSNFHRSQTLGLKNGYVQAKVHSLGSNGQGNELMDNKVNELPDLLTYDSQLIYGQAKPAAPKPFVPGFVQNDKKVLRFYGWFKEVVAECSMERYRVRKVTVCYYLVDDTICVFEPFVENSGLNQGTLVRRQKIPKNNEGKVYNWKDLNLGVNINCYGRFYHLYDCDRWTREFMESEGIELNHIETCPEDDFQLKKEMEKQRHNNKSPVESDSNDKLRRFLELDKKVLRFHCLWNDTNSNVRDKRRFVLHYHLVDDTIEIRELHEKNNGYDPFPVFFSRNKVPKMTGKVNPNFPSSILELSKKEVHDFISPKDLQIGRTILVFNRPFLLYNCDDFTKAFYFKNYGLTDFTPHPINHSKIYTLKPEPASTNPEKVDFSRTSDLTNVVLRYEAVLDTTKQEFKARRFILSYHLVDATISIYERQIKNSGIIGGKFLERTKVSKPNSCPENPEFYSPADFYVGARLDVFRHRFVVVGADDYVMNFMRSNPQLFHQSQVESFEKGGFN